MWLRQFWSNYVFDSVASVSLLPHSKLFLCSLKRVGLDDLWGLFQLRNFPGTILMFLLNQFNKFKPMLPICCYGCFYPLTSGNNFDFVHSYTVSWYSLVQFLCSVLECLHLPAQIPRKVYGITSIFTGPFPS